MSFSLEKRKILERKQLEAPARVNVNHIKKPHESSNFIETVMKSLEDGKYEDASMKMIKAITSLKRQYNLKPEVKNILKLIVNALKMPKQESAQALLKISKACSLSSDVHIKKFSNFLKDFSSIASGLVPVSAESVKHVQNLWTRIINKIKSTEKERLASLSR
jgi:hypothetical protein